MVKVVENLLRFHKLLITELRLVLMGGDLHFACLFAGEKLTQDNPIPDLLIVHFQAENQHGDIPFGHVHCHIHDQRRLAHTRPRRQDDEVFSLKPGGHGIDGREPHRKPVGIFCALAPFKQVEIALVQHFQQAASIIAIAVVGLSGIKNQLLSPGLQLRDIVEFASQGGSPNLVRCFH